MSAGTVVVVGSRLLDCIDLPLMLPVYYYYCSWQQTVAGNKLATVVGLFSLSYQVRFQNWPNSVEFVLVLLLIQWKMM